MRLDKDTYRAVQRIYYPGFTIGGAAEPLGIIATALLLFLTPAGTVAFWLVLIALLAMLFTVATYWLAVHPVNKHWMEGQSVSASGATFFGVGSKREARKPEWTELRDRWEYSHVARAVVTSVGLIALVVSLVVQP
ncbi:anthrone oxygenase family protein [Chelativorans alearense]|uniref:anthrone oxygenase family protein n=1 Tax=Chelativorans alearense TaxID=2681495 RepID=UPI001FE257A7